MWSVHSTYEVHFGTPAPDGGTRFASDIGTSIRSSGVPFAIMSDDIDHDGQIDVMFTTLKVGTFDTVGMIVEGMLTRHVSTTLEFYRLDGGIYPDKPSATRKIKAHAPGVSGERGIHHPSVLIGDVNGDSHSDLLVQKGQEELQVFVGVPESGLFARKPQRVAVAMPDEEYTWLVDLNGDGKQDILMHHPSSTEPQRVTMLIAR